MTTVDDSRALLTADDPPPAKRPVAVMFVGVLALAAGLIHLVGGGLTVADGGSAGRLAEGAFDLAFGVLAVAIGRGALRMSPWAWTALMTWAVIGLTHQRNGAVSAPTDPLLAVQAVSRSSTSARLNRSRAFGPDPSRRAPSSSAWS